MEPSSDEHRKTEERKQAAKREMQEYFNAKQGPFNLFPKNSNRSKTFYFAMFVSVLPAYLINLAFPRSRFGDTSFIIVLSVFFTCTILINIFITRWVIKKPADSKWHIFFD